MLQDATWYGARWGPSHSPLKKGYIPIFGPCLLWPNGRTDRDTTWCEGRPRLRPQSLCYMRIQLRPQTGTAPNFWPISIVAKRSPVSATVEHLFDLAKPSIYNRKGQRCACLESTFFLRLIAFPLYNSSDSYPSWSVISVTGDLTADVTIWCSCGGVVV